jgi:hypothetical protein
MSGSGSLVGLSSGATSIGPSETTRSFSKNFLQHPAGLSGAEYVRAVLSHFVDELAFDQLVVLTFP